MPLRQGAQHIIMQSIYMVAPADQGNVAARAPHFITAALQAHDRSLHCAWLSRFNIYPVIQALMRSFDTCTDCVIHRFNERVVIQDPA